MVDRAQPAPVPRRRVPNAMVAVLAVAAAGASLAGSVINDIGGLPLTLPLVAALGAVLLLRPAAFFGLEARRVWFAGGRRPTPSQLYLTSGRISGGLLLAVALVVPYVL